MSNTTNEEQEGIFNIQNNANETHKANSPLITHTKIDNTPFTITGNEEQGYFVRMGDYRLTDLHKTPGEAQQQIEEQHWHITMRMIGAIIERFNEQKETTETAIKNTIR